MTYHLHHEGRDLGVATLEELRRRRQTGELTGAEFVWCAGMAEWRPLDGVLGEAGPGASSSPPALPRGGTRPAGGAGHPSRRALFWIFGSLAMMLVLGVVGIVVMFRAVRTGISEVAREPAGTVLQPLPVGRDGATQRTVLRRSRAFRLRQWLEGYRERGERNHPADGDGIRLIENWIEANYGDAEARQGVDQRAQGELAEKVGRTIGLSDPLLLSVAAQNMSSTERKRELLERAVQAYAGSNHRAYPRLNTAVTLLEESGYSAERRDLFNVCGEAFQQSFVDGSFLPEDQPEIAEIMLHGWASELFRRGSQILAGIAAGAGPDYAWLAQVLEGEHQINEAWRRRGVGYADTVTEEGWKGYAEHLAKARTNLMAAWQAHPEWPIAASMMIKVAMGESGAVEMRRWFDRAVSAQIDYPQAWERMRWGLRPRWSGDLETMLAFGRLAVESRRFDTDVPRKFFDVVRDVEAEQGVAPGEHLYGRPDIWPHFREMYEGYLAEPTQARWAAGWRRAYGVVAYFAGQYDVARQQMAALDWQLEGESLARWGRDLSLMTLEVAARTGPLGASVTEAEGAFARADTARALELYRGLQARAEADDRTRQFIGHRLAILQWEERYRGGDWVPVLPSGTNDPAWSMLAGEVQVGDDGVVTVESEGQGYMIACRARLGAAWEVEGEMAVETPDRGSGVPVGVGVAFGLPTWDDGHWYSFRLTREAQGAPMARFSRNWRRGAREELTAPASFKDGWNTFRLGFNRHRTDATVNGVAIFGGLEASAPMRTAVESQQLALTGEEHSGRLVVKYRNLRARRR